MRRILTVVSIASEAIETDAIMQVVEMTIFVRSSRDCARRWHSSAARHQIAAVWVSVMGFAAITETAASGWSRMGEDLRILSTDCPD